MKLDLLVPQLLMKLDLLVLQLLMKFSEDNASAVFNPETRKKVYLKVCAYSVLSDENKRVFCLFVVVVLCVFGLCFTAVVVNFVSGFCSGMD